MNEIFVSNLKSYFPPEENIFEKPKLEFADPLFKRRLSQISRMTIQVLHDLIEDCPEAKNYKQIFVSFRGELSREFSINKSLILDSEILPAAFSLSVFNTPIASASLCLQLKGGYSVIYPSKCDFKSAVLSAASVLLSGAEEKIILVYADEAILEEYKGVSPKNADVLAFACILQTENKNQNAKKIDFENILTPKDFVKNMQ